MPCYHCYANMVFWDRGALDFVCLACARPQKENVMPTHGYTCDNCDKTQELKTRTFQPPNPPKCEECGEPTRRLYIKPLLRGLPTVAR